MAALIAHQFNLARHCGYMTASKLRWSLSMVSGRCAPFVAMNFLSGMTSPKESFFITKIGLP
jgi:hypothetical protein